MCARRVPCRQLDEDQIIDKLTEFIEKHIWPVAKPFIIKALLTKLEPIISEPLKKRKLKMKDVEDRIVEIDLEEFKKAFEEGFDVRDATQPRAHCARFPRLPHGRAPMSVHAPALLAAG